MYFDVFSALHSWSFPLNIFEWFSRQIWQIWLLFSCILSSTTFCTWASSGFFSTLCSKGQFFKISIFFFLRWRNFILFYDSICTLPLSSLRVQIPWLSWSTICRSSGFIFFALSTAVLQYPASLLLLYLVPD